MSADNTRPPIIRKGSHNKSPSMALSKKNKLEIGELDISVIECSDDKEFTNNNMLNLTEDNIMRSLNQIRPFE
jgi:hypothetical protein